MNQTNTSQLITVMGVYYSFAETWIICRIYYVITGVNSIKGLIIECDSMRLTDHIHHRVGPTAIHERPPKPNLWSEYSVV